MAGKLFFFCIFSMLATAGQAGSRVYVVSPNQPHQPAAIKTRLPESGAYLRDPTLQESAARKPSVPKQVEKQPQIKASRLSFKKTLVRGRITQPRVAFERENLDVPMVGESLPTTFLDRFAEDDSLDRLERGGY